MRAVTKMPIMATTIMGKLVLCEECEGLGGDLRGEIVWVKWIRSIKFVLTSLWVDFGGKKINEIFVDLEGR